MDYTPWKRVGVRLGFFSPLVVDLSLQVLQLEKLVRR